MLTRLWSWFCSLKVAIVLASLVTAIAIAGSLLMHFNPQIFAGLDTYGFGDWHRNFGRRAPLLASWFYLTGALILLLAVNTACCFIDWLLHIRSRWRKIGEYLIHLGFALVVFAYFWGSFAGSRAQLSLRPGQLQPVAFQPGYFLRLESIEPVIGVSGRPVDLLHNLSVFHGDTLTQTTTLHANTPLFLGTVTIVASGSGQQVVGYNAILPDLGHAADLIPGALIPLAGATRLQINDIRNDGNNPHFNLTLVDADIILWEGWYTLQQALPDPLRKAGFHPIIRQSLMMYTSELTINNDPGRKLALLGGICLTIGVLIALFSFYAKRRRGDRPDIA